ncbi:MAG: nucleotidyltransferase family protein [Thaumarchaeota archaeon]|nr:nucleotidyltransferase family protein [Candidatus Calditenuaceae archaeon]MCX8203258.1 nucleotidyltransferase family protein [Nitrososphaeria archaeon]MDW8043486.1 nucleotidyltransferase family protein [Nitrososphaerota archaeon]
MRAVILSGGEGRRLRPLTYYFQKSMVPVGRRQMPLLYYIMANLAHHGIRDFLVLVGYKSEQVVNFFGDGSRFGWRVSYVEDAEGYSGTGGAMLNAIERGALSADEDVLVHYGDILTNINASRLVELHRSRSADAVIALSRFYELPVGVARVSDGRVIELQEKPRIDVYVTIGVLTLSGRALGLLRGLGRSSDLMRDLMPAMIEKGMAVYPYLLEDELWFDVGTTERYEKLGSEDVDSMFGFLRG